MTDALSAAAGDAKQAIDVQIQDKVGTHSKMTLRGNTLHVDDYEVKVVNGDGREYPVIMARARNAGYQVPYVVATPGVSIFWMR